MPRHRAYRWIAVIAGVALLVAVLVIASLPLRGAFLRRINRLLRLNGRGDIICPAKTLPRSKLGPLISGERPLVCRHPQEVSQQNPGMERHAAPLVENAGRF